MAFVTWFVWTSMAVAGVVSVDPGTESSAVAKRAIAAATGQALQGKIRQALAELHSVPAPAFIGKERAIRNCMIGRFESIPQTGVESTAEVVSKRALRLYRYYWRESLLKPETRGLQEERLAAGLRGLLGLPVDAAWDRIEADLRQRMEAEGRYVLMGRTPPLMEFIVWSSEDSSVRQVQLPEGKHSVKIKVLDDFVSLGWSAYATCDRSFTGGWVKADGISAVRPGWKDLAAENFQVSFLAHETQHFADKERFGKLESWELEYRAKLAELALADVTLPRILSAFTSNQGSDPSVPHSFANRIVLSWLVSELGLIGPAALTGVAPDAIRKTAKSLLRRDSASRTRLKTSAYSPARPPSAMSSVDTSGARE